jgi:hypothetical protein
MLTGTLSIRDLFDKNVHHLVPLFQRPYVWEQEEQWEPLWADVRRLAEALLNKQPVRAHFLGASVHEKKDVPPGQMETRVVIDGQQRLTTVQLLLQAFENVIAERGFESWRQALSNLTRNNHPPRQRPQQDFKLWPTNADRDDFRRTMEAGSPASLRAAYGAKPNAQSIGRQIPDAYLYFFGVIDDWLCEDHDSEVRLATLYGALYENVRLVVIDLDEKDDAQLIFETLNARGTPLLAADLVKNALLQEVVAASGDPEDQYQQYWQAFDDDSGYWRQEIGRGHAQRHRMDVYLQHYLTLQMRAEVSVGHLYTTYKDFAERPASGSTTERLVEIAHYAAIYRCLDYCDGPPRVRLFLQRLQTMDVGTAYPFLMGLFSRSGHDTELLVAVLENIESFLVRRMVCRLSTRGYNRLFVDLLQTLDDDPADILERVRLHLVSGRADVDRWPDEKEFADAWIGSTLFWNVTRPRLRLLLEGLEGELRGSKYSETTDVPKNLTVEHIMPQSWEGYWPLPEAQDLEAARAERGTAVQTIGNLTLLSEKLNPAVSNGPWTGPDGAGKRQAIAEHTVLHLNKSLCSQESWTEAEIRARSEALLAVARTIWSRPAAVAATEAA